MGKKPSIAHTAIVDYILSGHSTDEARVHFGFSSDNIANLRVHAAFKALHTVRPRFAESRICRFCGTHSTARNKLQWTCGSDVCQRSLILAWHQQNPESTRQALARYRRTDKGRASNIRMHRAKRVRGTTGTVVDRWEFAATEIAKSRRKLWYLAFRNPWEYRIQHIQKMSGMIREFNQRNPRKLVGDAREKWYDALRAVQTTLSQATVRERDNEWERAVSAIAGALRSGVKVRRWKQTKHGALSR